MSAQTRYFPPGELRALLAESRAAGVEFEHAWADALPRLAMPASRSERAVWVEALAATRCEWMAAYEGRSTAFSEVGGMLAYAVGGRASLGVPEWSEKTLIAA